MDDLLKLLHHGGPHSPEDNAAISSRKKSAPAVDLQYNSLTDFRTHVPLTAFANSMELRTSEHADADIKVSSSKILAKEHFGAMDWHEEFVWDGILAPQDTVLAVELTTLLLPPTRTSAQIPHPSSHPRASFTYSSSSAASYSSSSVQKLTNSMTSLFWGNNTNNLRKSNAFSTTSPLTSMHRTLSNNTNPLQRTDTNTVQNTHKDTFLDRKLLSDDETNTNDHRHSTSQVLEKDLRIATLLIPLSRLPAIEDADMGEDTGTTFVVEKWYQLQSNGSLVAAASRGKVGVNLLPSVLLAMTLVKQRIEDHMQPQPLSSDIPADTDHFFTAFTNTPTSNIQKSLASEDSLSSQSSTALRPHLDSLEIIKTPLDTLDKVKPRLDEFTAVSYRKRTSSVGILSPTFADKDEPFYPDHVTGTLLGESIEEEKGENEPLEFTPDTDKDPIYDRYEDGPLLSPGIVDHLLVIGVKNIAGALPTSNLDLRNSGGWINHVQPECCILEQFPPVDMYNRVNDRYVTYTIFRTEH
jgi:hypothetical protein